MFYLNLHYTNYLTMYIRVKQRFDLFYLNQHYTNYLMMVIYYTYHNMYNHKFILSLIAIIYMYLYHRILLYLMGQTNYYLCILKFLDCIH